MDDYTYSRKTQERENQKTPDAIVTGVTAKLQEAVEMVKNSDTAQEQTAAASGSGEWHAPPS